MEVTASSRGSGNYKGDRTQNIHIKTKKDVTPENHMHSLDSQVFVDRLPIEEPI